jgi:hypothetical protein
MFVDSNYPNSYNSGNPTICTSTWINASALASGAQAVNSSNFNTTTTYSVFNALQPSLTTYSGNTLTLPPAFPGISPSSTVKLYLRIGLKMSSPAAFGTVSAQYTN